MITEVTLYTDGACSGNPGPGGYGVVLIAGPHRKELSGGDPSTTNNRMEMLAVITGLKALKVPCHVQLFTDSKYVGDPISDGRVKRWHDAGWMLNKKDPCKNPDLWEEIYQLLQIHRVEVHWVKGHADNEFNNRCDQLAVAAAAAVSGK